MSLAAPQFSIIVPTYRRPRELAQCLDALRALRLPPRTFEVIVVDDGSGNPPASVVDGFRNGLDITLVSQGHAGPAAARNTGAQHSRGAVLVFVDDDCRLASDYLNVIGRSLSGQPWLAVGGRTINAVDRDICAVTSQSLVDYLYRYYNAAESGPRFFTTNNIAVPREGFLAAGGFDVSFPLAAAEDRDFCDRWRELGNELRYVPEAIVYHGHRLGVRGFARQHFTYGRGAVFLHRARTRRGLTRPKVEPFGFYLNLVRHPFKIGTFGWRAPIVSALAIASQLAYGLGYGWELAVRRPPRPPIEVAAAAPPPPEPRTSDPSNGVSPIIGYPPPAKPTDLRRKA